MAPKIGERVFVRLQSPNKTIASMEHISRVADMDDELLHLEIPISTKDGKFLRLVPKDRVTVCFVRNGVPHDFETEVVGFREDAIPLVSVKPPAAGSVRRSERRNFLRVPAMLNVSVELADGQKLSVVTVDIGGGGICFVVKKDTPIYPKDKFNGRVQLRYRNGQSDTALFVGRVIRIEDMDHIRRKVMCNFEEITEPERQKVIRYCLERQLEFRD
jgi:c-di-GMP-binding flagellar brake protein YcgR